MPKDIQKQVRQKRLRNYLTKDFDAFRSEILSYARTYFPNKIRDFTEASLGGLLLDMAAMVGDSLSFYLDHQFNELNPLTAIERNNIINHLNAAGVPIVGASPAVVEMTIKINVPSETSALGDKQPMMAALPIIEAGTNFISNSGITFNLVQDVDFSKKNLDGELYASSRITAVDSNGQPSEYEMMLLGTCVSGVETIDSFVISNNHLPFRTIALLEKDVTDIISVNDSELNKYYEVGSLTQDVIFGGVPTIGPDGEVVEQEIEVIPAPYRFTAKMNPITNLVTLQFGSGNADLLDDDLIPDPSSMALPLYGKKNFSRFVLDPNSLLGTQSLGISPRNTEIFVKYRHGGGLTHNVPPNNIQTIGELAIRFPMEIESTTRTNVENSVIINNETAAGGGLEAPSLEDFRLSIPSSRNLQSRIVSKGDMLARIYTLPSRFGRVYRASISPNPNNPLASLLYVICKDENNFLTTSPDPLKKNLKKYLNEYRLVSDAVDVLDARILNFGIEFSMVAHPRANKQVVVQQVISALISTFGGNLFQINQPLIISDIVNTIINVPGVISMLEMPSVVCRYGTMDDREYSFNTFEPRNLESKGLIIPPDGSIFELKYPNFDIIGNVV